MALSIFGWQIRRKQEELPSFAPPSNDDGAAIIQANQGPVGGSYGTVLDLDSSARTEADLVTKYRSMAQQPEVRAAIDNIVNEAIVVQKETPIVQVDLSQAEGIDDRVKEAVQEEFEEILRLLEFKTKAYEIFRSWYIDARLPYHVIIKNPKDGIAELRYLDPRKIKKVKEVKREKMNVGQPGSMAYMQRVSAEYYIYNEKGFGATQTKNEAAYGSTPNATAIKIAKDSIVYVTSGLLDETSTVVYSYLHEAIRPLNMFRTVSDSAIIYRLVRAPQRRVFYIDVGDLPKHKAEQYVNEMMEKYKNKLVFDPTTGSMRDQRKHMTMLEDFWLSRREGGRGTQIDTLDAAANWGVMDEVQFFLKMLYKALHVPLARLDPEYVAPLGRVGEITREEVDFAKFIDRVRVKFCELFLSLLEKQLILKGIMQPEEWDELKHFIDFDWAKDNYFAELKELAVATERYQAIQLVMPFVGRYVSNQWVRKKLLFQTDEEFQQINQQIMAEREDPMYQVQIGPDGQPMMDMGVNMPDDAPRDGDGDGVVNDAMIKRVAVIQRDLEHDKQTRKLEANHAKEIDKHKDRYGELMQKYRELRVQNVRAKAAAARKAAASKK